MQGVGRKILFHNLAGAKESMIIAANVAVIMGCYPCFTDEEIWGSEMLNNLLVITQVESARAEHSHFRWCLSQDPWSPCYTPSADIWQ